MDTPSYHPNQVLWSEDTLQLTNPVLNVPLKYKPTQYNSLLIQQNSRSKPICPPSVLFIFVSFLLLLSDYSGAGKSAKSQAKAAKYGKTALGLQRKGVRPDISYYISGAV